MKLLRYGPRGQEKPGILDDAGVIRDLSSHILDITAESITPTALERLSRIDTRTLPPVNPEIRIGVPIKGIGKCIGIGLNYSDHAKESGMNVPTEPPMFSKAISALSGPNDDVMLPRGSVKSDWEVELGVVIGRLCRYVDELQAPSYIVGFTLVNDISERAFQLERGTQWDKGKGCDTFGPVGPWLVTTDEIGDPQNLEMFLSVNGERMQYGNTRNMIFGVHRLIAYISRFLTLYPGDLIITGTPAGVGLGKKPEPAFLRPGDVMRLGIEGLGEQLLRVVHWRHLGDETLN